MFIFPHVSAGSCFFTHLKIGHLLKSRNKTNSNNFSEGGQCCHGNSVEWPSEAVDAPQSRLLSRLPWTLWVINNIQIHMLPL